MTKNIVPLLILVIILLSCNNEHKSNYVDKTSSVLDSTYAASFNETKNLFNKINNLQPENLLSSKPIFLDSLELIEKASKLRDILRNNSSLSTNLNLNSVNTIIINNTKNWSLFYGITDSITNTLKHNYIISELPNNSYTSHSLYDADAVPNYFLYYHNQNFFNIYKDSINVEKKNRLKINHKQRLSRIKQIKYALILNDMYIMKPNLIDKKTFSPGFIISRVELYNLNTKELLGQTNIHSKNSKEIRHLFAVNLGNTTAKVLYLQLQKDLLKQKHKKITEYFKIK